MNLHLSSSTSNQYLSDLESWFSSIPLDKAPVQLQGLLKPISNLQQLIRLHKSLPNLEQWFASIPLDRASDEDTAWLQPISDFQQVIGRKQKQVAFFGAFNAGKSTLLNAIVGKEILPSHTNRATGVVTKIDYASQLSTKVITRTADGDFLKQAIPYEDLAKYILLDLSSGIAKIPEGIEEVSLSLPLPLVRNHCILVDTPGLMDDSILTERSFQEVAKSDLAVMVLSADKLLSEVEKESAQRVHELLNGNLVFIVNRLGLVEEEERTEVLEWAQTALQGLDNPLIGQPCIFYIDAKAALEAKTNGGGHSALLNEYLDRINYTYLSSPFPIYSPFSTPDSRLPIPNSEFNFVQLLSLLAFERWLEGLFNTSIGEKIAILSRLAILENHLSNSRLYFQAQLTNVQTTVKDIANAEAEAWAEKQAKLKEDLDEDRLLLSRLRTQLYQFGNDFASRCRDNANSLMEKDTNWQKNAELQDKLSQCFFSALDDYTAIVYREVTSPALQTQIKVPDFYISKSDINTNIIMIQDKSVGIGSGIGAAIGTILEPGGGTVIGAAVGAWIGKKLLGVDVKKETLNSIEQKAKEIIPTITLQAEEYLDQIDRLLIELKNSYAPNPPPSTALQTAQQTEQYYTNVVSWVEEFQNTINEIKEVAK